MNIFKRWQRFFEKEETEIGQEDEWIEVEETIENRPLHTKPNFRFPLISDEERNRILTGEVPRADFKQTEEDEQARPLYMHEKWRKDRENTVIHRSVGKQKDRENTVIHQSVGKQKERSNTETKSKPLQSFQVEEQNRKKSYMPSKFASPVFGYDSDKKQRDEVEEHLEHVSAQNVLEEWEFKEATPLPEPELERDIVVQTPLMAGVTEDDSEQTEVIEPANVIAKEAYTNSEENDKVLDEADSPIVEEQKPDEVPQQEQRKSNKTTPFNVLMLKSDRQRMEMTKKPVSVHADVSVQSAPSHEKSEQAIPAYNTKPNDSYTLPSIRYLLPPETKTEDREWMDRQAAKLEEALSYFQVKGKVISIMQGPTVTQFELTVGHGTKVSKIRNLTDDLKLALAAKDIRIQAPIPGRSSIGIEIPNRVARPVRISEIIGSTEFRHSESPLEAVLGLDLTGKPATIDLRKMPHGLIAGATGSGKSVSINSILISLLYKSSPEDLRLLLIDPKVVELAPYNHIPHLISPVITDVKAANAALKWAVEEMERRYQLFAHTGVRDITRYNAMAVDKRQFSLKLPYILIVIDELADLMMMAPAEVEESISRIAQKARACGIHLIIATQRPSVDVITGLIKANIPTRIAFSVSSQIDSRTIIDIVGAERLLGRGDMLYLGNGMSAPSRLQGTYVSDEEIEQVVAHVRNQAEPDYFFQQEELIKRSDNSDERDELFEEACRFIVETGNASTSLLQRKFHIGYNRAARLIDQLEENGFISEQNGSKPREVYLTEPELSTILNG